MTASAPCVLSVFGDWNLDGDFMDAGESVFPAGQALVAGSNIVGFAVPSGASVGPSFLRFRCTTDGAVPPFGTASDGEVEDYPVTITEALFDFGDARAPFPTLLADDGARHTSSTSVYLGQCVDVEPDGQPSALAIADDPRDATAFGPCPASLTDDGVTSPTSRTLYPGSNATLDVTASAACTLSAWIDFNDDGDWLDAGEDLGGPRNLAPGVSSFGFLVPASATGAPSARFRCTTAGPIGFSGPAPDGEVEDYVFNVDPAIIDYGDAPDSYGTTLATNGARHRLGTNVFLGSCVDAESDGQPNGSADGDDLTASASGVGCLDPMQDDEDGVRFVLGPARGQQAIVEVTAAAPCILSAFVDYDIDGDFADPGESLFPGGQPLAAGTNTLSFNVPSSASVGGTFSRFRCSTVGPVGPLGESLDGEVEDYAVTITEELFDFGDAPEPAFPTTLASNGARHRLEPTIHFGDCIDLEPDGQPDAFASGDDSNAGPSFGTCPFPNDEGGIVLAADGFLHEGSKASFDVSVSAACTLSAWIDFNADGDWGDPGEDLLPGGLALSAGITTVTISLPATAVAPSVAMARFRCTTDGAVPFDGLASDGEVEDYALLVQAPTFDFGDAPDSYRTTLASNGARHRLGTNVYLGTCVDDEGDGQPAASADLDDLMSAGTVFCSDDENGVSFVFGPSIAQQATVEVVANAPCTLSAFADYNLDGDFGDVDETLFPSGLALQAGLNTVSFAVPATATAGNSMMRFRCTTDGAVTYQGEASDGEVEDYAVTIRDPLLDFGHAPPPYPTTLAADGARHRSNASLYLGACVDVEEDGLLAGDNSDTGPTFGTCQLNNTEDGIALADSTNNAIYQGSLASFDVSANAPCVLSAWIDFDTNGSWLDPGDDLLPGGLAIGAGVTTVTFSVPPSTPIGVVYARFRCTSSGAVGVVGEAPDGEVEDYAFNVLPPALDFGDAPASYGTQLAANGARHFLGTKIYLGGCVDGESDGQVTGIFPAGADDETVGVPQIGSLACTSSADDEGGVTFLAPPVVGEQVAIEVTANAACILTVFADYNRDGDFLDPNETVFPTGRTLSPGVNAITFGVPDDAMTGDSYMRFRCSSSLAASPLGPAPDGEVEDYAVTLFPGTGTTSPPTEVPLFNRWVLLLFSGLLVTVALLLLAPND